MLGIFLLFLYWTSPSLFWSKISDHGEESSPVRSVLIALAISIIFIDLPLACYEFTTTDVKSSSYGSILITVHFILKVIASLTMALLIVLVSNSRWKKKVPLCSMLKATVSSTFTFATIFKMLHQLDYSHMSEHESSSLARWYQGIDDSLVHEYHGSFCEDCLSLSNFQVMICPVLFTVIFYGTLGEMMHLLWLFCLASLIFLSIWQGSAPLGYTIIYYFIASALIFYEIRSSYRIRHSKEKLLKDSCEEALRLHDQEMKNMVGNVAHDLKTPLSSFKAAIDVIKDVVDGMMSNRDGDGENSSIVEGLHTIKSCAESIPSSDSKLKYTSALQPFSESSHSSNFQDSSMNGNMESFTDAVSSSNKSLERTFVASFKPTLELHLEDASRRSDSVRRVLLVEDSPSIYKMISIMLRRQGFHVTIANNGAEALTKIRAEVGRLFSSQQSTDSDVVEEVQRCGFDGFLSKPFSIEAFMQLFNEKLVTS
eukprot:gene8641-9521_t